jgi:hypothetical protein
MATILIPTSGVTALQLIESAMSKINKLGAGDTVSAEDADIGIRRLNALLGELESDNLFNYATTRTIVTLPSSTTSRTIGPGMQIAMVRPVEILRGSFSRLDGIDYPLEPVSEREYNLISQKDGFGAVAPMICFYDGGTPTGNVYFWPDVGADVELHLLTPQTEGSAADTTTLFNFPPGYQTMVEYNLAIEIAPDYNVQPSQLVQRRAASTKVKLKRTNSKTGQLQFEDASANGNIPIDEFRAGVW